MSTNPSSNSSEYDDSRIIYNAVPISFAIPAELVHKCDEILQNFQRWPEKVATFMKAQATTVDLAAAGEAVEPTEEECRAIILSPPPKDNVDQSSATGGSRRGRKRKSDVERESFYSRRPDWLPEGWTTQAVPRKKGVSGAKGMHDRVIRSIGL